MCPVMYAWLSSAAGVSIQCENDKDFNAKQIWSFSRLLLGGWCGLCLGGLEDGGMLPCEDLLRLDCIALHNILQAKTGPSHSPEKS